MNSIFSNSLDRLASIYASTFGPNNSLPWVEIIASILIVKADQPLQLEPKHYPDQKA